MYIHTYMFVYACDFLIKYIYIYIYVCVCVCVCVCVFHLKIAFFRIHESFSYEADTMS